MLGPVKTTQVCPKATTYTEQSLKDKFIARYTEYVGMNTENDITGYVELTPECKLQCDFEVIAVLKAIIKMGVTSNTHLAYACRELFQSILKADPTYVSRKRALAALSGGTYEKEELIKGIKEVLT